MQTANKNPATARMPENEEVYQTLREAAIKALPTSLYREITEHDYRNGCLKEQRKYHAMQSIKESISGFHNSLGLLVERTMGKLAGAYDYEDSLRRTRDALGGTLESLILAMTSQDYSKLHNDLYAALGTNLFNLGVGVDDLAEIKKPHVLKNGPDTEEMHAKSRKIGEQRIAESIIANMEKAMLDKVKNEYPELLNYQHYNSRFWSNPSSNEIAHTWATAIKNMPEEKSTHHRA